MWREWSGTHDSAALLKVSRSDHYLNGRSQENCMYPALNSRMNEGQTINETRYSNVRLLPTGSSERHTGSMCSSPQGGIHIPHGLAQLRDIQSNRSLAWFLLQELSVFHYISCQVLEKRSKSCATYSSS